MPMLRAFQTLLAIESGALTPAGLDTVLADPGRYSEWQVLCSMEDQVERMLDHGNLEKILGSRLAMQVLCTSHKAYFYNPKYLSRIAPSAWGIYLPYDAHIEKAGATAKAWRNALGVTARNFNQAATQYNPVVEYSANPVPGLPTMSFDANDFLTGGQIFNQANSYTVFAVYRRNDPNHMVLLGNGSVPTSAQGLMFVGSPGYAQAISANAISEFTGTAPADVGQWGLSTFRRQSASALYHSLNGGPWSNVFNQPAAIPPFSLSGLNLGFGYASTATFNIAEVWLLAGNGNASSPEIQRITTMLKAKYGL